MKSGAATALEGTSRLDLLLISDLKQALRQPGCPLCRALRDADLHYLRVFLREGKDDGRMLLRLLGSWGLCARHASGLVHLEPVERGDGLGTGTLYDWLLDYARRRLEDFRQRLGAHDDRGTAHRRYASRRTIDHALSRLSRTWGCPACEAQRRCAEYVVKGFGRALEPASGLPVIQDMYLASEGLCLRHCQALLGLQPTSGVRELIMGKQRQVVVGLKAALDAHLERGVTEEVPEGGPKQEPAFVGALAAVGGDTTWQPPER